ncbi:monovalent cation/H(+) antiporter subunit G [Kitasatospora sp. NRRL B-11411]|uniref:monovalent cation/H(+) antiporter subunit G n=1 Tax=Kitasatospora sp. NRRL B-11411 TaxID=1463822 RepID=UPI00068A5F78|nr:monovalent cation/H(+) antiporter subunit G [Kitasatospora sp. NRRL B-11411]
MSRHALALGVLAAGSGALLLAAAAFARLPGRYLRLHALAAASTLGVPLTAVAVAVQTGPGRAAGKLLLIGALVLAAGPVTTMAIGRLTVRLDPGRSE